MSPAQTSDRLPQPTAKLKVLCRAEGGHYCWPSCTGGNIEGGVKRLQGSTQHSHILLCWPFSSAKMQQVTFELKPLTEFFFVTCSRSTVCHLVAEAWNNMNRELRGEIVQIGEKMTSLTHVVNASERSWTETESEHADPVQAHSEGTQMIISLLQIVLWSGRSRWFNVGMVKIGTMIPISLNRCRYYIIDIMSYLRSKSAFLQMFALCNSQFVKPKQIETE